MKSGDRFPRFESAPKKPPPKHGIKVKKPGTTWWGLRWIEALHVVLSGDAKRLARGRTYARAGRTHDLRVARGKVTAKVTGSRSQPYAVRIELPRLDDAIWEKAIAGMADRAQFSAELLCGQMPLDVDTVFRESGASLFPAQRSDLVTDCTCPDWGDPCKHVAAAHYVLGEAFDRDPFLLFELRGRTKDQVLSALRAARAGTGGEPATAIPKRSLGALRPEDYDRAPEALPSLHLSFDEPLTHGAVLRQLGAPVGWNGDSSPVDLLGPLVRAAADKARCIALADPSPETANGADDPVPPAPDRTRASAKKARRKPGARPQPR
jgi:uncharacterized Zn finger protein